MTRACVIVFLLCFFFLYSCTSNNKEVPLFSKPQTIQITQKYRPNKIPIVIIDAGHGGEDPGAINDSLKLYEKNVCRKIVDALIRITDTNRIKLIQTRIGDVNTHRHERVKYANTFRPDLLITVHNNSSPDTSITGYELSFSDSTFVDYEAIDSLGVNVDTVKMLNPNRQKLLEYVAVFDKFIRPAFPTMIRRSVAVRKDDIWMIYAPKFPSILLEFGFISNNREAVMLSDPKSHLQIATAVRNALYNIFYKAAPKQTATPGKAKQKPKTKKLK